MHWLVLKIVITILLFVKYSIRNIIIETFKMLMCHILDCKIYQKKKILYYIIKY